MSETSEEYYRALEKAGLEPEEMGYELLAYQEAYRESGKPFGHSGTGFALWIKYSVRGGLLTTGN